MVLELEMATFIMIPDIIPIATTLDVVIRIIAL
jgi:hypothetical protein